MPNQSFLGNCSRAVQCDQLSFGNRAALLVILRVVQLPYCRAVIYAHRAGLGDCGIRMPQIRVEACRKPTRPRVCTRNAASKNSAKCAIEKTTSSGSGKKQNGRASCRERV